MYSKPTSFIVSSDNGGALTRTLTLGLRSALDEINYIESELIHRILLSALSSSMLEGYPSGETGNMNISVVNVNDLSEALRISSGSNISSSNSNSSNNGSDGKASYACETELCQSMRRLGALLLLVRTSVMSGDWNGVRLGLNAYTDTLSTADRNITVREVFTSLRSGDDNECELDGTSTIQN